MALKSKGLGEFSQKRLKKLGSVPSQFGGALLQRWAGPDFFGFGSGSGFILRARALSGLKKLLNKSGFIRARARALLRLVGSGFGSYLLKSPSLSPNFGLGLRPDPSLPYCRDDCTLQQYFNAVKAHLVVIAQWQNHRLIILKSRV